MLSQIVIDLSLRDLVRMNGAVADVTDKILSTRSPQINNFLRDCPDAFAGLTRLCLQNMRFGESDIANILIACKRLESLCFFECDAGICSVLHVQHARLIELAITFGEFKTVELSCKLQRLTYNYWPCDENPLVLGIEMKTAVNIQDISLHDRKVCKICTEMFPHIEVHPSTYPRTDEEKDSLRKKITMEPMMMSSSAVIRFWS
jgi:hypothetical protein